MADDNACYNNIIDGDERPHTAEQCGRRTPLPVKTKRKKNRIRSTRVICEWRRTVRPIENRKTVNGHVPKFHLPDRRRRNQPPPPRGGPANYGRFRNGAGARNLRERYRSPGELERAWPTGSGATFRRVIYAPKMSRISAEHVPRSRGRGERELSPGRRVNRVDRTPENERRRI